MENNAYIVILTLNGTLLDECKKSVDELVLFLNNFCCRNNKLDVGDSLLIDLSVGNEM